MKEKRKKAHRKALLVVNQLDERVTEIIATANYTSRETAFYLRLKPQTLEAWRCLDRYPGLKPTKIGGRIRYKGADILAFEESGR